MEKKFDIKKVPEIIILIYQFHNLQCNFLLSNQLIYQF